MVRKVHQAAMSRLQETTDKSREVQFVGEEVFDRNRGGNSRRRVTKPLDDVDGNRELGDTVNELRRVKYKGFELESRSVNPSSKMR